MHPTLTGRRFYLLHLWLPLLAALPLGWLLLVQGGDLWLADRLFAWEGGRWALRTSPFLQEILHVGGRRLSIASGVLLLIALTVSGLHKSLRSWRRPLLYLITATACAASAIALLKAVIDIDCPWDLARYGGQRPFIGLFATRPAALPSASCFPAGHASSGYAWVSLYFFFLTVRPAWARYGLWFALGLGALFGAAQQLRGAHFLSHDLSTLLICWLIALAFYRVLLHRSRPLRQAPKPGRTGSTQPPANEEPPA